MDKIYTYDNKKAFTMVELLAVIIILGILLIIAVPTVLNVIPGAKKNLFVAQVQRDFTKLQAESLFDETAYNNSELDLCLIARVTPVVLAQIGTKSEYEGFIIRDSKNQKIYATLNNGEFIIDSYSIDSDVNINDRVYKYNDSKWREVSDLNRFCRLIPDCHACMEYDYTGALAGYYLGDLKENIIYPGNTINQIIKNLAGGAANVKEIKTVNYINNSGMYINLNPKDTNNSGIETYLWYDKGTIYFGTNGDRIYFYDGSDMFSNLPNVKTIDLDLFDFKYCSGISSMFAEDRMLEEIKNAKWNVSGVSYAPSVFRYCESLISLDVSDWDTSNFNDISDMFGNCKKLEYLEVTRWNTSNVEYMNRTFCGCETITYLNVSLWDTSKVKEMNGLFQNDFNLLELDVSNFDTSNVTDMSYMFCGTSNVKKLDLTSFNTSKVKNFNLMFNGMHVTAIDVSNFDMSSAENVSKMFYHLVVNTSITFKPKKNTKSKLKYDDMFYNCPDLEMIDLSFMTQQINPNIASLCPKLKTIYVSKDYTYTLSIKIHTCPLLNTLTKREDF